MARSVEKVYSEELVVSLAMAKIHLRIGGNDNDDYITNLIYAATQTAEDYCNISIMKNDLTQWADGWNDTFELYMSPIQNSGHLSLNDISYYDEDNVLQIWHVSNYNLDASHSPARIYTAPGKDYPAIANRLNAIRIRYSSGADDNVKIPKSLIQGILILVGQWYENRQEAIIGRSVGSIPMTARYIFDKYRIRTFGLPQ